VFSVVPISADGFKLTHSGKLTASTTDPSPPSPPRAITLEARAGGSLTISWTEPMDYGGLPLVSHHVTLDGNPAGAVEADTFTYKVERLRAQTSYKIRCSLTRFSLCC
jgi:hypothetical protein